MGCLAAYFTHVQSCDVTLVQSAIRSGLLPCILHIRTSCSTVEGYLHLQAVASREDVTCRSCRGQGASRHVTSRQDVTGAAVDKEAVTSRHVTSGRHRRRRGQGGRHVTSRHVTSGHHRRRRGQGCRHVTSGRQAPSWTRRPSRHVMHDHSRFIQEDGAQYLIEYLEMKLGPTPVPAAGTFAEELFVKLRRPHGMTMSTWCSQVREAYRRLQRALNRARIERGEVSVPMASTSSTPSGPRSCSASLGSSGSRTS